MKILERKITIQYSIKKKKNYQHDHQTILINSSMWKTNKNYLLASQTIQQTKFMHFPLGKAFKKQTKATGDQWDECFKELGNKTGVIDKDEDKDRQEDKNIDKNEVRTN